MEELDFDPDIIAKFLFPEIPPWTYPTAMVNLTLLYAKKDQTDPSKYLSLHNEVKDVFRDYDFIYTDGSVSDDKAAAAAVIDNYSYIERLSDKSSIFSAGLHALYLALDRVETADDDERNFVIFSGSKSALQAISGQDWTHPLVLYILERLNWLVQYQEKRILFYWIPKKVHISRVRNCIINRVIWVGSYFSCKMKSKLFSSGMKWQLICLNTKTLGRRCSTKGAKRKPQTLVLNRIQQRDIIFTCCSVNKTSIA